MHAGLGYLRAHIEDGLFLEDPRHSGAKDFALLATYWRDYGIGGRRGRHLYYPCAFLLVQAQVVAALRELLYLAKIKRFSGELARLEGELKAARKAFLSFFGSGAAAPVAIDAKGPIHFVSTDPAHALYYLEPDDVSYPYLCDAQDLLGDLKTPWGFKTWKRDKKIPAMNWEPERIWPWEHAFIAQGLKKHGAYHDFEDAISPARFLAESGIPFTEFLELKYGKPHAAGCHVQLWTCAYWAWVEQQHLPR